MSDSERATDPAVDPERPTDPTVDAGAEDDRPTLEAGAEADADEYAADERGLPQQQPGVTPEFEHPTFKLDAGGMVVPKDPSRVLQGAEGAQQQLQLVEALVAHVQAVMTSELGFEELRLPAAAPVACPIFVSANWATADKLLVVVQQGRGTQPGIWSRSTCLRFGLANGSMLPCLRSACELEFGVVVMNPSRNKDVLPDGAKVPIEGSATPAEHVHTVWESVVARAAAPHVFVLAFGRGSELVPALLAEAGAAERVRGAALIESSHQMSPDDPAADFFRDRAMHWHASEQEPPYAVAAPAAPLGCPSLSMGSTNVGSSNAANTIPIAMPSVMRFMHEMGANAALSALAFAEQENALFGVPPPLPEPPAAEQQQQQAADEEVGRERSCYNCSKDFTLFDRRHHCRGCGRAVCNACSRDRLFLPNYSTAQRVCGPCVVHGPGAGPAAARRGQGADAAGQDGDAHRLQVEDFELLKVVGKGAFGKVLLVRKRTAGAGEGQIYAMKILKKSFVIAKNQVEHTLSENRIMRDIDHPFLVRLRFSFSSPSKLYLVMDYYSGGSLYFHLKQSARGRGFRMPRARFYAAELLLALSHLHSLRIVYRDLKLENVLLSSDGHLALTDFGLSKENVAGNSAKTFCGTAEYIAPELISGRGYGPAVDYWALGILIFEMLHGQTPFFSRNRKSMFSSIINKEPTFPHSFTDDAKDLISGLLFKDPARRLGSNGVEEVKAHPFFADIDWDALYRKDVEPPFAPGNDETSTDFVFPGHVDQPARDSIDDAAPRMGSGEDPFGDFTYKGETSAIAR